MAPSAVIAVISRGNPAIECCRTLMHAVGNGWAVDLRSASMYVDAERNRLVADFLDQMDFEWMVWFDDDMSIDIADLELLTRSTGDVEQPVVSGVYASMFDDGPRALAYRVEGDRHLAYTVPELYALPRVSEHRVEVDSVGAGCLALHRSTLEHLRANTFNVREGIHPWFIEPTWRGRVLGEDHGLCSRLRAMGIPILVDTRVRAKHYKTVELNVPPPPSGEPDVAPHEH